MDKKSEWGLSMLLLAIISLLWIIMPEPVSFWDKLLYMISGGATFSGLLLVASGDD